MKNDFLWWRDGVIYQIYPRSFLDTTGSGIGDLNGITDKVDYLANLGVDAIWLSPINPSPDVDFGYDVSDYKGIDSKFGTMADFERLVETAEKANIRIVMDLVLNHTSNQHPWFLSARSSRENPTRDYYIWQDAGPDGKPPNNWCSVFGGRGWEWDKKTGQFYYHMFYKEQPDLNWRNPRVQTEFLDVFKFWLGKGVKGFRLDVFNVYFKDAQFRNNPTKLFGRRPFDRQVHRYDYDQPELTGVLNDIREVLDGYDAAYAIGETFLSTSEKAAGYCGDDLLHACFNFEILEAKRNPQILMQKILEWENALGDVKWPNYVLNNHDTVRCATRFGQGEEDERMKVMAAMLLTLRGTPFLYYGEEIGMRDIRVRRKDILDPIGKRYWPIFVGRDGCRAPMQWNAEPQAGFSTSKPWLPVHPNYKTRNVNAQANNRSSLLNFYKKLLAFRRSQPALIKGDFVAMDVNLPQVMAYKRSYQYNTLFIFLNFSRKALVITLPVGRKYKVALSSKERPAREEYTGKMGLMGDEALILCE